MKVHISETPGTILLEIMWDTDGGAHLHSKNHPVLYEQHEVTYTHYYSSCQYTHGCDAPASWAARHTTMCLNFLGTVRIQTFKIYIKFMEQICLALMFTIKEMLYVRGVGRGGSDGSDEPPFQW